jgi:hypothetical protein
MEVDNDDFEHLTNSFGAPFNGILSKEKSYFEKLNFEQKKEILILNEIFCPLIAEQNYVYKNLLYPYDRVHSKLDTENNILTESRWVFRGVLYSVNSLLIDDICRLIEDYVMGTLEEMAEDEIERQRVILENYIDIEERKKYISNQYEQHFKNFREDENLIYFKFNDLDVDWRSFVDSRILKHMSYVEKHLFNENYYYYDVSNYEISKIWLSLEYSSKMMSFFRNFLNLNSDLQILEGKKTNIDLSFQISLLEEIINLKDWSEITATKKGEILNNLLGKNKDNIKKIYLEFDKKSSEISNKMFNDRNKAAELIKKILG